MYESPTPDMGPRQAERTNDPTHGQGTDAGMDTSYGEGTGPILQVRENSERTCSTPGA